MINETLLDKLKNNDETVKKINLSCQNLHYQDIDELSNALINNTKVISLILNNCNLSDKTAEPIIKLLRKNHVISRLELACNNFSEKMVEYLHSEFEQRFNKQPSQLNRLSLKQFTKRKKLAVTSSLCKEEFISLYLKTQTPVLVKGGVKSLENWTPQALSTRYKKTPINVKIINYAIYPRNNVKLKTNFGSIFDLIENNEDENIRYYSEASPILNKSSSLREELDLPSWAKVNDVRQALYLWVGQADTMSGFHYDKTSNLGNIFMQLYGEKLIRLYPPSESQYFSMYREQPYQLTAEKCDDRVSASKIANIDETHHPFSKMFDCANSPWIITLQAGDILYMPAYFWHDVRSISTSISVNCWLESSPTKSLNANGKKLETSLESIISSTKQTNNFSALSAHVEEFISAGGDPNYVSNFLRKTSLLNMAVVFNLPTLVRSLLLHPQIKPNKVEYGYPYTPFCLAIEFGFNRIVKLFLAHPDINPKAAFARFGYTPLTLATEKGNVEVLNTILPEVDILQKDGNGNTAIEIALKQCNYACLIMLLANYKDNLSKNQLKLIWPHQQALREKALTIIRQTEKPVAEKVVRALCMSNSPLVQAIQNNSNQEVVEPN